MLWCLEAGWAPAGSWSLRAGSDWRSPLLFPQLAGDAHGLSQDQQAEPEEEAEGGAPHTTGEGGAASWHPLGGAGAKRVRPRSLGGFSTQPRIGCKGKGVTSRVRWPSALGSLPSFCWSVSCALLSEPQGGTPTGTGWPAVELPPEAPTLQAGVRSGSTVRVPPPDRPASCWGARSMPGEMILQTAG